MVVAESNAAAIQKEAGAEAANSDYMEGARKHDEKLKMAKALRHLAEKGHMVVSGKKGQEVLDFYNDTLDVVSKR